MSARAMGSTLVTVYIPTRNRAALLRRAVASVLAQGWRELEVIVVDDASTDDTRAVLQELAAADRRLRPLFHAEPAGACAARNTAIAAARGRWLTGCDDDDWFEPWRLQELVAAWQALERAGGPLPSALYTPYRIDDRGGALHPEVPEQADAAAIKARNVVGCQVFALTDTVRAAGGFDAAMPAWQDLELWLRIILAFGPMRRAGSCSYVQDQTHGLARISTGGGQRIRAAYDALLARHGHAYSRRERALLHLNYLQYEQVKLMPADLLRAFAPGHLRFYASTMLAKLRARFRRAGPR